MAGQHRAGGKFTKSHTTLIEAAVPVVDRAEELPEVTKISLGEIKVIGRGMPNVKYYRVDAGWRLVIRGNLARQEIYIYTSDPDHTRHELERLD